MSFGLYMFCVLILSVMMHLLLAKIIAIWCDFRVGYCFCLGLFTVLSCFIIIGIDKGIYSVYVPYGKVVINHNDKIECYNIIDSCEWEGNIILNTTKCGKIKYSLNDKIVRRCETITCGDIIETRTKYKYDDGTIISIYECDYVDTGLLDFPGSIYRYFAPYKRKHDINDRDKLKDEIERLKCKIREMDKHKHG